MKLRTAVCLVATGVGVGLALITQGSAVHASVADVTYNHQIAAILYGHCTSCHHAGGSGPFALMTYADAKRWGPTVERVTQARYMPPWLPSGPHNMFAEDRRLSANEIDLIKQWVDAGMVEGDPHEVVKPPTFTSDWQLGPPDLILEMNTAMSVPAGGTDLFRNFILPVPITQSRWVRAMEIKPGTPQVVHHANLAIDRSASLRRMHPADWQAGIPGMDVLVDAGEAFDPDSHFLYWKPDSSALVERVDLPWRLDPGNDLVLNMHLKPTGKPETVRARIGLYFTPNAAKQSPMLLQLENDGGLDIPAGKADFAVEDQLQFPEDVDLLAIYPHAHYLGKRLEGWAVLPGGERRELILIENWDIDRQSIYRYAKPLFLPAQSVVHMRYTYDNSAENPHNPHSPPIRVRDGNRSEDEMGHLWLQVLPRMTNDGEDLRAPLLRAWMEHRLHKYPHDPIALFNVASIAMSDGQFVQAADLYRKTLEARPGDVRTMTALASAENKAGHWKRAVELLYGAIETDATYSDAHFDLAVIELQHGDLSTAEAELRAVIELQPADAAAHSTLGGVLLATEKVAAARAEFDAALKADERNFEALFNMATIELDAGQVAQALEHLKTAEMVNPQDADVHKALAEIYSKRGQAADALREQRLVAANAKGTP